MTAIILALLLSQAADAPMNPHAPGRSMHLSAGEVSPLTGQILEDTEHARREWNNEKAAGKLAKLEEKEGSKFISVPVLVAIVAGSLAVGVAVGAGVALAAKR